MDKLRILLVEDDPDDALLLRRGLENAGYNLHLTRVMTAEDLEAALDREPWDVVLADYNLPRLDAPRALAIVRRRLPDIPFIIVSGTTREDAIVQCMRDGASDFFVKGRITLLPLAIEREIQAAQERQRRNRVEQELRETERRLAHLFASSPVPYSLTRVRDQVVLEVNQAYVEMLGYRADEIVGHTVMDLNVWADPVERVALIEALKGPLPVRNFEFLARNKSGRIANILLTADIVNVDGEPCVLSMAIDITERKQAEAGYRLQAQLLNTIGQAVILTDLNGVVQYWNHAAELLYGWPAATALGKSIRDLIKSDMDRARGEALIRQVAQGGSWSGEITVEQRDGHSIPVFISGTPLLGSDGSVMGIISVSADISSLRRVEHQLRESEERHRVIVENIFDAVLMTDAAGRFTFISPSVTHVFGLSQAEIAAYGTIQALLGSDIELPDASDGEGAVRNLDLTFTLPSGAERAIAGYVRRVSLGDSAFLVSCRDVTESRLAAEALRQSELRFRVMTENARDLYALLDVNGRCMYTSPAYERLLGYTASELLDTRLFEKIAHPDDWYQFEPEFAATAWRTMPPRRGRMRKADGGWLWIEGYTYPIELNGQDYIVAVGRDLTDRLQLEEERLQTERLGIELQKQKELNDLKSRFVSMVSHEFRTPLAAIQTSSDLLHHYHDRMTEDRRGEHLVQIGDQVRQLTRLLDEVLTLSRADTVGLKFEPQPVDMAAFVSDVVADLQHTSSGRINTCVTPALRANIDVKLFREALANLLTNALKYSPDDQPVQLDVEAAGDQLVIRVADRGIGIPEADCVRLFDPFHRASNVGNVAGTGLGLAIVKRAIDAHGGTVSLDSRVGQGTTFTVSVPLTQKGEPAL